MNLKKEGGKVLCMDQDQVCRALDEMHREGIKILGKETKLNGWVVLTYGAKQ